MRIRDFTPKDAPALVQIFHDAVHQIGARDYTPAQCAAWSPAPMDPDRFATRMADGRSLWVAVDAQDRPKGFIELERDGHIDCFYLAPDCAGQGVGAQLYAVLEAQARCERMPRLYVEASEAARRFFLRAGFQQDHRRDFVRAGVAMHNFAMSKLLRDEDRRS